MASTERFRFAVLVVLGAVGWAGIAVVGAALASSVPSRLGFDLRLVLEAGQRVAMGQPVYAQAVIDRPSSLDAADLFYSYPPVVAQLASVVSGLTIPLATIVLALLATAGAVVVGANLVRGVAPQTKPTTAALAILAALPFVFPFAIAILFGNVDALYAAGFGLVLLGTVRPSAARTTGGGIALGLLSVAKVHPALLAAWLVVRGFGERGRGETAWAWRTFGVAIVTAASLVLASLAAFGSAPWAQYVDLVRAIADVRVVIPTNVEPAAQLGLVLGLGEPAVRMLHVLIAVIAAVVALVAAWRIRDPVVSLAVAATASLVVLPITWFHYPAALIPFAIAAVARDRSILRVGIAAVACSLVSIAFPVAVWSAVALVFVALRPAQLPERLRSRSAEAGSAG